MKRRRWIRREQKEGWAEYENVSVRYISPACSIIRVGAFSFLNALNMTMHLITVIEKEGGRFTF